MSDVVTTNNHTLTPEQQKICDKFLYGNFVAQLTPTSKPLTREEILYVERLTRGQSNNALWNVLRLDRQTASGSVNYAVVPPNAAMSYGLTQEQLIKENDTTLLELLRIQCVEKVLRSKVVDMVLECGLFLSPRGLYSASPDAYFVTANDLYVPLEIKCPMSYKDITVDEMRNSLGTRKDRYRVKHTALSVNRRKHTTNDVAIFAVEKTDPHYRQMQRQMYVMNAPICVYLVKFKDSFVAQVVRRDETFFATENKTESKTMDMFINMNKRNNLYVHQYKRRESFHNKIHNFTKEQIEQLTLQGLYYNYGNILCAFCSKSFEGDTLYETLVQIHSAACSNDQINNRTDLNVVHVNYFDCQKRVNTLVKIGAPIEYAKWGLFYDNVDKEFKTFCCDIIVNDKCLDVRHADDCQYGKMVVQHN
ncbi:Alkaline exonuclease [Perigonia lusca single nucleopolyhedrovirus]|uniref:Alkaline exonuclease n=1 Tax=Perigonia lusca single nucleopolyhedrovirus TaxID=1675865 RepID=A0A0M3WNF7_9ABAC|nr:Alkaline exonuclease [Perigonia lusca single nucleopolyhedrovirus]AKN80611.1 Alkaline exonuclease [Perigonia lusca single nucleopolyhedrovirus]